MLIRNRVSPLPLLRIIDSPLTKNTDDQALSESELESRRAALLAQLNMQMDE